MSAEPKTPMERTQTRSGWGAVRRRLIRGVVGLLLLSMIGVLAWTWITLHFT